MLIPLQYQNVLTVLKNKIWYPFHAMQKQKYRRYRSTIFGLVFLSSVEEIPILPPSQKFAFFCYYNLSN